MRHFRQAFLHREIVEKVEPLYELYDEDPNVQHRVFGPYGAVRIIPADLMPSRDIVRNLLATHSILVVGPAPSDQNTPPLDQEKFASWMENKFVRDVKTPMKVHSKFAFNIVCTNL